MRIAAIDPGLDRASAAIFMVPDRDPRAPLYDMGYRIRCLEAVVFCKTTTEQELPERLFLLARWLRGQLYERKVHRVIIEVPSTAGAYAERRGRQRGKTQVNAAAMAKLHNATGALIAVAAAYVGHEHVELRRAQGAKKKQRLETVRILLRQVGREKEITNSDDRDAIGIGIDGEWRNYASD